MTTDEIPQSLAALFDLAADSGHDLCYCCLDDMSVEAGTTHRIDRTATDIDDVAAAACDRVLALINNRDHWEYEGISARQTITWIRIGARIASVLLPEVTVDLWDRFTVTPDEDGHWPSPESFNGSLSLAGQSLQAYIRERDSGEWTDPYAIAGAIADIHDAARAITVLVDVSAPITGR